MTAKKQPAGKAPTKKAKTKPRKKRYAWDKREAEFIRSDPEQVPTLEDFFKPLGISKNTYTKHTRTWHRKRIEYRQQIAREVLEKYRHNTVNAIIRQDQHGALASQLCFRELIGRNANGEPELKIKLKPGELIRLYDAGTRNQNRAQALARVLGDALAAFNDQAEGIPTAPATDAPAIDVQNEREVERRRLQAILKDPKAIEAAERILGAIEKDGTT